MAQPRRLDCSSVLEVSSTSRRIYYLGVLLTTINNRPYAAFDRRPGVVRLAEGHFDIVGTSACYTVVHQVCNNWEV